MRPAAPRDGAVDGGHAVVSRRPGSRLEVRLVDLHDVGPGGEEVGDLGGDGIGERHRHVLVAGVVVVLGLLGHREGTGDRDLDRAVRHRAHDGHDVRLDGRRPVQWPGDPGHRHDLPGAVQALAVTGSVDAVERVDEAVGVALAPHLAVGDDVEPGAHLFEHRQLGGIALRFAEELVGHPPQRVALDAHGQVAVEVVLVDQPARLAPAPDERGRQHRERRQPVVHGADRTRRRWGARRLRDRR